MATVKHKRNTKEVLLRKWKERLAILLTDFLQIISTFLNIQVNPFQTRRKLPERLKLPHSLKANKTARNERKKGKGGGGTNKSKAIKVLRCAQGSQEILKFFPENRRTFRIHVSDAVWLQLA